MSMKTVMKMKGMKCGEDESHSGSLFSYGFIRTQV